MGVWGYKLYDSDEALNIKDEFTLKIKQGKSKEEIIKEMIEENEEMIKDAEEAPIFWFTLADLLWKKGKLTREVKERAIEYISNGKELERWKDEAEEREYKKRKETLEKLKERLESPQPDEKIIKARKPYVTNLEIGDVYAYKLTQEASKGTEYEGKYVVFQMVEKYTDENIDTYGDILPLVIFFDKIFNEPPKLEELKEIEYIILDTPDVSVYIEIEPVYKMKFYSTRNRKIKKEDLKYIGNMEIKEYYQNIEFESPFIEEFDEWIMKVFKYNSLNNVKKELLVDKDITGIKDIIDYIDEEKISLINCSLNSEIKGKYFIDSYDKNDGIVRYDINTIIGRKHRYISELELGRPYVSKELIRKVIIDLKGIYSICEREFNIKINKGDYFDIDYKYNKCIDGIICEVKLCRVFSKEKNGFALFINAMTGRIFVNAMTGEIIKKEELH